MDTIHLKTVDPLSQDLLKSAFQRGIKLNWDRYEKLQPQDGFLRVGLSCPYGCLQGPCRIDPLGRGPDRGLCGLDRDRMVAALLLRLTLNGVLEAMNEGAMGSRKTAGISLSPPLDKIFSKAVKNLGGEKLSIEEVSRSAFYLNRPMESPEALILQALRLGAMALGLLEKPKSPKGSPGSLSLQGRLRPSGAKEVPHRSLRAALCQAPGDHPERGFPEFPGWRRPCLAGRLDRVQR